MCECPRCQNDTFDKGVCSKCGLKISRGDWQSAGRVLGAVYKNARYWIVEAVKGGHIMDHTCAKKYGANVPYLLSTASDVSVGKVMTATEWLRKQGYIVVNNGRYWPAGYTRHAACQK